MTRALLLLTVALGLTQACRQPTWGPGNAWPNVTHPPVKVGWVFGTFIQNAIPLAVKYETPIQFHIVQLMNLGIYSTVAMYEPNALDHWGRADVSADRRICSNVVSAAEFQAHRHTALAYLLGLAAGLLIPEVVPVVAPLYAPYGIDLQRCVTGDCSDLSTPWGLAKSWVDEIEVFRAKDGWNWDGSLSRQKNRIPYEDWHGDDAYVPKNTPWRLQHKKNWQPLLEHNGKGYLTYQEHVTPQIGLSGRSIFFTDAEICAMESPNPQYNLDEEMELSFARGAALTDAKKMQVELYDNKFTSLTPLLAQWYARKTGTGDIDSWDFLLIDSVIISALYESGLVVWKEKLAWDRVRPPSYAHAQYADETIVSWAGPGQGTQALKGRDWEPYIRTMPHAEYPSGSACACAAFESALKNWTGYDSVLAEIGGPLVLSYPPGVSRVEPGLTPAAPLNLVYSSWSEIASACSESRLDGGMHFRAAIVHGRSLCYDMGTRLAQVFRQLAAGTRPTHVAAASPASPAPADRCRP